MSIAKLLVVVLACCLCCAVGLSLPELQATQVSSTLNGYGNLFFLSLTGINDLAVTADIATNKSLIYKRNASGSYNLFASQQLQSNSLAVSTNGDWFGSVFDQGIELFRLNQNGQTSDYSVISASTNSFTARVLDDGAVMMAFPESILTYEFINNAWVVTQNSSFPGAAFSVVSFSSTGMPSNAFIASAQNLDDTFNFYIVTIQSDKSWKIVETINVNRSFIAQQQSFYWDGASTFMTGVYDVLSDNPTGFVHVFNKQNGEWELTQSLTGSDFITGLGYLGFGPIVPLDENHLFITAPADKFVPIQGPLPPSGSVLLLERNQQTNEWNFIAKFNSNMSLFGAGMARNDQDVLVLGCSIDLTQIQILCSLFAIPTCILDPINVTCLPKQDTCSTADLDKVITINNPSCGSVSTSIDSVVGSNNGISVDLSFSRPFVPDATCNVTLACSELTTVTPSSKSIVSSGQMHLPKAVVVLSVVASIFI